MKKVILNIGGMSCSACSSHIEKYLNKQKGVIDATVNLVMAQAVIEYDDSLEILDLERFIKEAGYESLGVYDGKMQEKRSIYSKRALIGMSFLAVLLMYIAMSHMIGLPVIPYFDMMKYPLRYAVCLFLLTILFLVYGADILKNGLKNLWYKSPNMDTLVTLGVICSFLYSFYGMIMIICGKYEYVENLYFESSAMILLFIKLGRYLDGRSREKTKEAIKELVQITPKKALVKIKNGEKEVTIDEVKKGDILIAKPGMKIAVDGVIVQGSTHLDEAFITGESIPSKKSKGDKVVAGAINREGYIEYRASKIGRDSTVSEIVRLVVEATNTKAPISRVADKVSSYFVPIIMVIAIITFFGYLIMGQSFQEAIICLVTVLVVACPCALGLATPLAIVVSEGICAKNFIIVKTSEVLENAHKVDTIVFDKTGTLTYGNLKISKIFNYSNYSDKELLCMVASLEAKSTHPIGKVFVNYAKDNHHKLEDVSNFKNMPGMGIMADTKNKKRLYVGNHKLVEKLEINNIYIDDEDKLSNLGNSIVYVIENSEIIGLIGVRDIIRKNAKKTILKLNKLNKDVIMLTGDNEQTAKIIADSLGIKKVIANVMPKDKTEVIRNLMQEGKNVMMVGDGINDAPSLALASIGVSVNSGTDIAADSADVILMNDNLEKIVSLLEISKKTIINIKENLFWAFFYNILMIPIAMGVLRPFGIVMMPMFASFAMTISSLTVVLNSLRLKRWHEK